MRAAPPTVTKWKKTRTAQSVSISARRHLIGAILRHRFKLPRSDGVRESVHLMRTAPPSRGEPASKPHEPLSVSAMPYQRPKFRDRITTHDANCPFQVRLNQFHSLGFARTLAPAAAIHDITEKREGVIVLSALTQTRDVRRSLDLYAAPSADPAAIRQLVQRLLSISLQRSESNGRVPAYRYRSSDGEIVDIQQNGDPSQAPPVERVYSSTQCSCVSMASMKRQRRAFASNSRDMTSDF